MAIILNLPHLDGSFGSRTVAVNTSIVLLMEKIRSAAVYNREGKICGVFLFHSGECVKYIFSESKGARGLLARVAPHVIGMSEKVFEAVFSIFIRTQNWHFSMIYEQDVDSFRKTFNNIIDEIVANAALPPQES